MPADLGLVADATERDAHEAPAHRPGDRFAEAGLADAGGADEGDDRAVAAPAAGVAIGETALGAQLARGEELDDAVLDVVEPVVVVVEDRPRLVECEVVGAALAPGQLEDAVEPRPDPAVLRRLLADPLEAIELLVDRGLDRVGGVEVGEACAELTDDVVVALAEFLADRRELLAQQVLALLLVDAFGHVVADRLGDLQLGEVASSPGVDRVDALGDIDGAEHDEPVGVGELGPDRDRVGERTGRGGGAQDLRESPRVAQLGDDLERGPQLTGRRVERGAVAGIGDRHGVGDVDGRGAVGTDLTRPPLDDVGPLFRADDRRRLAAR